VDSGLVVTPLNPPSSPITGWECVTESNANDMAKKILCVTAGTIYAYLSSHVGHESGEGTFRSQTRGYTDWASGHIDCLDINTQHPEYCHIQSVMKPSMKPGSYHVWLLLGHD